MARIHSWMGLLAGWILLPMFLTGTLSYFRPEITRWMQPELHDEAVSPDRAAAAAAAHLAAVGHGDAAWTIFLPSPRDPMVHAFARPHGKPGTKAKSGKPTRQTLDPTTGLPIHARATGGGELLTDFHYALQLPKPGGEWIAGACAMAMLAAIISGVITHRRIFADLFTMRWRKGQRSWLDAHNLAAVLGLPYHLVITYTGLITLAGLYMPWPVRANFATPAAYSAKAFPDDVVATRTGRATASAPLDAIVRDAQRRWGGTAASSVSIRYPGDAGSVVTVVSASGSRLAARGSTLSYSGATGRLIARGAEPGPGVALSTGLFGLHVGYFATAPVRCLLFLLGLSGTAMVGTGLILWSVKRGRTLGHVGHRIVERLNIAAIACFPAGIAAYLLANRLIPVDVPGRGTGETWALFGTVAALALGSLALPVRRAWLLTLGVGATLSAGVAVADVVTIGWPHDGLFATVDLIALTVASAAALAAWRLARPAASVPRRQSANTVAPAKTRGAHVVG